MARTRSRFDDDVAPKSDVYTGLLALSLIAMIVSCLLLFLDYSQYGTSKAPNVAVPQPKGRDGVVTGQLPPPLLTLPPPAPVGERPFTRGTDTASANPVKPVAGGEEASAPVVVPAPVPEPPPPVAVPIPPVAEAPAAAPAPAAATPVAPEVPPAPAPEPVAPPPTPAPAPPTPAANTPPPPPLPKSIRSLPN
jgi:hypothetical protein